MTVPVVFAISGVIALLLGILGGGIKAKEVTVPSLSPTIRFISIIVGVGLIGASLWTSNPTTMIPDIPTSTVSPTQTPIVETTTTTITPEPTAQEIISTPISDIYVEDFSKGSKYWDSGTFDNDYVTHSRSTLNDVLRWQVVAKKNTNYVMGYPKLPAISNFDMEATFIFVDGTNSVEYGLMFRRTNAGSYRFLIDHKGYYALQKYTSQEDTTSNLIDWKMPPVPINLNSENKLRVYAVGDSIRVYINDDLVGDVVDNTFNSGVVDVIAYFLEGEKITLDISSFKLRIISQ